MRETDNKRDKAKKKSGGNRKPVIERKKGREERKNVSKGRQKSRERERVGGLCICALDEELIKILLLLI